MQLFKKLFSSLNKASIKYMVAGGIAVNLYGIERATADVDIVLDLEKRNLSKFIKVAEKLGLRPKIPVKLEDFFDPRKRKSWRVDKGMLVFSLYDPKNPFFLIDIFTEIPFDFDDVYKQRRKIKFEEISIPVIPIKELIGMKEKSDRSQDRADVFYLKKIMNGWKDEK
ncbi:MAG: hypothetical protein ABSG71_18655 [Thermodesulfobacteriota bacterium]